MAEAGPVVTLDNVTGSWNLAGGSLVGGTFRTTGANILGGGTSGFFNGVVFDGDYVNSTPSGGATFFGNSSFAAASSVTANAVTASKARLPAR